MVMQNKRAQYKIQQMAFMIIFLFIFFILVGIFILNLTSTSNIDKYQELQRQKAISSVKIIADMPEFNCDSSENWCLDVDKLKIMSIKSEQYSDFFSVASIDVFKIYPAQTEVIDCPAAGCNHYAIYDNGQQNKQTYSSYVSICEKFREGSTFENCELAKLVVGVKQND
jgi:sensor histidine kinase regulating citrate/malate metabolism